MSMTILINQRSIFYINFMKTTIFLFNLLFSSQLLWTQNIVHQKLFDEKTFSSSLQENNFSTRTKKSGTVAVIYSLLLPGMGELYANGFEQGKYSLIAEGALWLTYGIFQYYGMWMQNDARNFSATHAGIILNGKDDQYFVDVGNFSTIYDYNNKKLRDRTYEKLYEVNDTYYWKWDTEENRKLFREQRVQSATIFNNTRFIIGAILVNHVISAVNAARLTRQYNNRLEEQSWNIGTEMLQHNGTMNGMKICFTYSF